MASGLIDNKTAQAIVLDVEAHDRRSLSFGSILAIMAALLLGAAILRLRRVELGGDPAHCAGGRALRDHFRGLCRRRDAEALRPSAIAEGVWLIAAAAFGGSIALIGQMYHLSGDETQAVLTWCAGTAVAAAALRSAPLTIAAVALAAAWLFLRGVEFWRVSDFPHAFIAIAAVLWLISYWTQSVASRHLLLLSLIFYAALLAIERL